MYAAALNHADLDAIVAKVGDLPWYAPAGVQLLIQDQEQSYFRLWMIRDGRIRQYTPPPPADGSVE